MHTHNKKYRILWEEGGGQFMKIVLMSNIVTITGIEKQNEHAQQKSPHAMGGWWAVHENGPYVKYRHYYWDRKAKCTHTTKNTAYYGRRVVGSS